MESIGLAAVCEQAGPHLVEAFTDRRREHRHRLFSAISVAFYNQGKLYRGKMTDLSSGGARLVLAVDTPDGTPDLSRGRKMECYLLNRHGSSKCRGAIQWLQREGSMLQWGISFIELPVEQDDPIRKSISEARHSLNFRPMTGMAIY